jgi:hypothetical protein
MGLVSAFLVATHCGVASRAIVKVGCAVGKESLRNTALFHGVWETT